MENKISDKRISDVVSGSNRSPEEDYLAWCELLQLRAALSVLQEATQVAIDNCETCHGETDHLRKCARCQAFEKLLPPSPRR